ncbi:MAG: hypothetical protein JO079_03145 [Frankiaceae bacterium]|nr:hypothetical protein [Frankiaceae bacterium]MBV9369648.1 hypothetical protein [Frankiales bacterium]
MSADDRNVRLEELLRTSLYDEAETIVPAGDGLSRIQSRVTTRRARASWWHPMAALGSVAVVAVAGFAAYTLTRTPPHPNSVKTTNLGDTPAPTPDASVSTPPAPVVTKPTFPASAFYPFTSEAAEKQWVTQDGPSKQPWVGDPELLAKTFVAAFVQQPDVTDVFARHISSRSATITLGRTLHDGNRSVPVKVTTISMVRFDKAWLVVGASDGGGELKVASPRSGQTVTSPAFVAGPGFGVDENVRVDVRSISGIARTGDVPTVAFGNGTPQWSTTVPFSAADPRGAVVVVELSAADGGPGRITAVGVNFATVQAASYPQYFYGVKNGQVTKFSSRTGSPVSYLTPPEPGGGASDPQLVGDKVYYLDGAGTCVNALRSVPVAGGAPTTVSQPDTGYVISGFGVSALDNRVNTFFETSCSSAVTPQGRLVFDTIAADTSTQRTAVNFPSFPPMVVGDPTFAADGKHVLAVVRTGTQAQLRQYDAYHSTSVDDGTTPCSTDPSSGLPTATQVDSGGAAWFATQTGSGMQVLRCVGGQTSVAFTVTGTDTPADVAVTDNGQAVLLTDTSGAVWRWTAGGTVTQLHPSVPQQQVAW